MNGNGINILDLLLGAVQPSPGQESGVGQLSPDGLPFDLILSQFTDGLTNENPANSEQVKISNVDLFGANQVDSKTALVADVPVDHQQDVMKGGGLPLMAFSGLPQMIQSGQMVNKTVEQNIVTGDDLSALSLSANGELKILDWAVSDDNKTLSLTVQGEDNLQIRISTPMANLDLNNVDNDRVPLETMLDKNSSMRGLFEKLNLKELQFELQQDATGDTKSISKPLDNVKIVADLNGQEKLIPIQLSSAGLGSSVKAIKIETKAVNKNVDNQSADVENPLLSSAKPLSKPLISPVSRPVAVADNSGLFEGKQKDIETVAKHFSFDSTKPYSELLSTVAPEKTELHLDKNGTLVRQRPVQFELPENTKSLLRPNGHSVQLRINPEHLGPARLSLRLVNNQLKAVVVVDNRVAKATLEGSIDRLVDALGKADISVDSIEVNINGESAREHLFDQSPRFSRKINSLAGNLHEQTPADEAKQEHQLPLRTDDYISASGVNLVA